MARIVTQPGDVRRSRVSSKRTGPDTYTGCLYANRGCFKRQPLHRIREKTFSGSVLVAQTGKKKTSVGLVLLKIKRKTVRENAFFLFCLDRVIYEQHHESEQPAPLAQEQSS